MKGQIQKINYQKQLDEILKSINPQEKKPTLLLHACCGPCSSYVIEYLSSYFDITIFYYNPNITEADEYAHREEEEKRLKEEAEAAAKAAEAEKRFEESQSSDSENSDASSETEMKK